MLFDNLITDLKKRFQSLEKERPLNSKYTLSNILMCGFAMFSMKEKSLYSFVKKLKNRANNLENIFKITQRPSDTTIRKLLDEVETKELKSLFKPYLSMLDNKGILKDYNYIDGYLLSPIDGSQYFKSNEIHCEKCLTKKHKNGKITYHHNALGAVIVHPNRREVFPITIEDISQQDGTTKNDCELNAARRIVPAIRENLSGKKIMLGGDAIYANGPFIRFIHQHQMRFIFSVKEGSHSYLFLQAQRLEEQGKMKIITKSTKTKTYITKYANGLILNGTHRDILVNFIHVEEHDIKTGKVKLFNFICDTKITSKNYSKLVKAGRARWKIENETFNTIKNQGYQFEHNFGHGKKYLAANFSVLMLLAFLFDQIQQRTNVVYRLAAYTAGTKLEFWAKIRHWFDEITVDSMQIIYKIIAKQIKLKVSLII